MYSPVLPPNKTILKYLQTCLRFYSDLPSVPHIRSSNFPSIMPRGPQLSQTEKAQILTHQQLRLTDNNIASILSRSRKTIIKFICEPKKAIEKPSKPTNQKLTEVSIRRNVQEVSKTRKFSKETRETLDLPASIRRVQQISPN